jgi:N-acetylmuramoyl-L-alanine amidase
MRGPAVTRLQQRLRAIGVFRGEVDGVFGSETQTAVQSAQRRYNLTPDGVVGNATWGALLR